MNKGEIAQLVEQWTENPCVRSSILRLATTYLKIMSLFQILTYILLFLIILILAQLFNTENTLKSVKAEAVERNFVKKQNLDKFKE